MRLRLHGRKIALLVATLAACQWSLTAQTPAPASKRPLAYTDVDYWKSIQGQRLSHDGQWLAYSITSQAEDGELIVRQTAGTQEFRSPRGTNPTFTPDGRFVIFTIVPLEVRGRGGTRKAPKGEAVSPPSRAQSRSRGPSRRQAARRWTGRSRGHQQPAAQLARHHGAAVRGSDDDREGRQLPDPRGGLDVDCLLQGHRRRRPGGRRPWRARRRPPAAAGGRQGGAQGAGRRPAPNGARRPGSDLILRNLASGEETTIPEVVEYQWNKKGDWLAYSTSSPDAEKDGAFARRMSDGAVTTLHSGRGTTSRLCSTKRARSSRS
jgi:hypothetical protein